ncbi:NDP-hexose 2,3-dehydratase family protein [Streptomyces durbertensis]|uniref:NDP-hexose 2,3-dehydratase family protein n=1 Tax=Streptomyces durbertensis TaxID=2448886 RepID=A0ABR6ECF8_9ACTN|nr:NDP-hexose 2,3-dehydratase family protein [Streptomyces durbertensis]
MSRRLRLRTEQVDLADLAGWRVDPGTGDLRHTSGRFFTVEGLGVDDPDGPVPHWEQPVLRQPEVGILGILLRRRGGEVSCLMQAKDEPGNAGDVQLSPTVQATRSNYSRAHGGRSVPYLEFFRDHHPARRRLVDVRQSEQGSWFDRKSNRNMVVETTEDVPALPGFRWTSLRELRALLSFDDVVNMDTRSVLACLPPEGPDPGGLHSMPEVLSWITDVRSAGGMRTTPLPLARVSGWRHGRDRIFHESGRWFDVIGVRAAGDGREVGEWCQPMIAPRGQGVAAFLLREFDGVPHVAVRARRGPGYVDVAELGPTVQCTPENYEDLPRSARPPYLADVLDAPPDRVSRDVVLSEEGGRFHHARNRYLVVRTDAGPPTDHPDFRWLTLHQLGRLLRHSHYVNVEARTLVACLHGMAEGAPAGGNQVGAGASSRRPRRRAASQSPRTGG